MKITILADNYVDTAGLVAEHGFSCLVETGQVKILFDTGQGAALLNNMDKLKIPKPLDMIVFSHGHYDHTGGFSAYLSELSNFCKEIYASEHIFDKHLKKEGESFSDIGLQTERKEVEKLYNLHLNSDMAEISKNIFLSGSVKRFESFDADKLLYSEIDLVRQKDMFRDEQYLIVREEDGIHIITGCTHCGASNLIQDAAAKFPDDKILSLTGGLHMFRSTPDQVEQVISFIESQQIGVVNTGHCTGLDASMLMKERLGDRMNITKAGLTLELL